MYDMYMDKIIIEPGTRGDLPEMESFFGTLFDYLESHINNTGWKRGSYPTAGDIESDIDGHTLFVARHGGMIIGSIVLDHIVEEGPGRVHWTVDADDHEVLSIHRLAVHPGYYQSGVASRLLAFTESFARAGKIKAIRLDVGEKNDAAIRLYEKNGYKYIDTVDLGPAEYDLDLFRLYEKVLVRIGDNIV